MTEKIKPSSEPLITECCLRRIQPDERYCPRCGWECRVLEASAPRQETAAPPISAESNSVTFGAVPKFVGTVTPIGAESQRTCNPRSTSGVSAPALPKGAASSTREEAGELAIELCRDLYDRFVMGGWEPLDAHDRTTMKIEDWADSREQRYREALQRVVCKHDPSHRSGGNDYSLCEDCGLVWDYRKIMPQEAAKAEAEQLLREQ